MRRIAISLALLALIPASAAVAQDVTRTIQQRDANGNPIGPPRTVTFREHPDSSLTGELVGKDGAARSPVIRVPDARQEPKPPPEPKPAPEPKETPGLVPEDR